MEHLIFSLEKVLPLFILMALGFFCRQIGIFSKDAIPHINKLVFRVFLPVLLCRNIMTVDKSQGFDFSVMAFAFVAVLVLFLALMLLVPVFCKDNRRRGVIIQGIMRSNYAFFGIPLVESMYPESSGIASMMVVAVVPLFNALSVIALKWFSTEKPDYKNILKNIVTNPLIIGSLVGLVLFALNVTFPPVIESATSQIGRVATPLALFTLGASLNMQSLKNNIRPLLAISGVRLLLIPLCFMGLSLLLGYRHAELASLMVVFGAPTAVNSYTMAQQMDCDDEFAGQIVILTTILSALTVFLMIFFGKTIGVF